MLVHRRSRGYDPAVVDALVGDGERWLAEIGDDPWARVLGAEPAPSLTPLGHFTEPVQLRRAEADPPRRVHIRCRWPNVAFDQFAATAQSSPDWSSFELASSHLPYITNPDDLTAVLLELAQ